MSVPKKDRTWITLVPGDMVVWIDAEDKEWYDLVIGVILHETRVEVTFMLLWHDTDFESSTSGICSGHFTAAEMMSDLGCYKVEIDESR